LFARIGRKPRDLPGAAAFSGESSGRRRHITRAYDPRQERNAAGATHKSTRGVGSAAALARIDDNFMQTELSQPPRSRIL
jgi:hypothetical protein